MRWQLIAADLRRLRLVVLVWLMVVVANRVAKGASPLLAADPRFREWTAVLASMLWVAELLLVFLLVSLVIHAHPTVGSDAFWLTHHSIEAALPLRLGAMYQHGAYRLIVDGITPMNGEVGLIVREARAASMWERPSTRTISATASAAKRSRSASIRCAAALR